MALPKRSDMSMVRGDTYQFDLKFTGLDPENIAAIYFTVKKKANEPDETAIFQKGFDNGIEQISSDTFRVRVSPEDTDGVAKGTYHYDIQVNVTDDVYTLIEGSFVITQDTTHRRR